MNIIDKIDEAMKVIEIKLSEKEVKQYAKEIMKKYNCRKLIEMVDDQVLDYVDSDWEDDGEYDSEQDWYIDHGRGEAESDIIENIVREFEKKKKEKFHIYSFVDIGKYMADKCNIDY